MVAKYTTNKNESSCNKNVGMSNKMFQQHTLARVSTQ